MHLEGLEPSTFPLKAEGPSTWASGAFEKLISLFVRPTGIEPVTLALKVRYSSQLSYERIEYVLIKARNFKMQTS